MFGEADLNPINDLPVALDYVVLRYDLNYGIWWAAAILVFVYLLISFEVSSFLLPFVSYM